MPDDRYSEVRRSEHSTIGDAGERYQRDADAFMCGAQWALDNMVSQSQMEFYRSVDDLLGDYLIGRAAEILGWVHRGEL